MYNVNIMSRDHRSIEPQNRAPKSVFFSAVVVIFFLSLSAASSVGFVPDYIDGSTALTTRGGAQEEVVSGEVVALSNLPELGSETAVEPDRIIIGDIGLDLAVQNPGTRDITELDEFLKNGPARYVDSAKLGEQGGNILLFAHSSNLPVVRNQMYKAFNRVKELEAGDTITLQGDGKSYLYMVTAVKKVDATDTRIDMRKELGTRLTLVTCDTLTSKEARFVVEASLIGVY
jgi:LPXTG-site transpeptidase (sortase) family protein